MRKGKEKEKEEDLVHENVELVHGDEGQLHNLPERHHEADGGVGLLAAREGVGVAHAIASRATGNNATVGRVDVDAQGLARVIECSLAREVALLKVLEEIATSAPRFREQHARPSFAANQEVRIKRRRGSIPLDQLFTEHFDEIVELLDVVLELVLRLLGLAELVNHNTHLTVASASKLEALLKALELNNGSERRTNLRRD